MNPTLTAAHEAGARTRAAGWSATDNPHDDWLLGVAWAAGWHGIELAPQFGAASPLEVQTGMLVGGRIEQLEKLGQ